MKKVCAKILYTFLLYNRWDKLVENDRIESIYNEMNEKITAARQQVIDDTVSAANKAMVTNKLTPAERQRRFLKRGGTLPADSAHVICANCGHCG